MSESVKKFVVEELLQTLDDPAENGISDEWEGDEGEAYFVSATAAESLVILGYAENVSAVFEKARQEGRRVQEKRNLPA